MRVLFASVKTCHVSWCEVKSVLSSLTQPESLSLSDVSTSTSPTLVVKYASAKQNFLITGEEIFEKIDQLPRPSGGTDGGIALNETFATLFNSTGTC